MGCDAACQAKKKAAIESAKKTVSSAGDYIDTTTTTVTTVAMVLGVAATVGAIIPSELFPLLGVAKSNPLITKSKAGGLIAPVQVAVGTFMGLTIAQKVFNVVLPAVKLAAEIAGIILLNFALLPQLLADIGVILLAVIVGLAPIFLAKVKNILMEIPVDVNSVTTRQLIQIKSLMTESQKAMKEAFISSVSEVNASLAMEDAIAKAEAKGLSLDHVCITHQDEVNNYIQANSAPYVLSDMTDVDNLREHFIIDFENGMSACKGAILDLLVEKLKSETISILDIDDVNFLDSSGKTKTKNFIDGTINAEKKLQILQDGEILRRQFSVSSAVPTQDEEIFDDNDLSVAAANSIINLIESKLSLFNESGLKGTIDFKNCCMSIMNEEISKKKAATISAREEIDYIDLVQELIIENKESFISSIEENLIGIDLMNSINLDPVYEQTISNEFIFLKSEMESSQIDVINSTIITNTAEMINLKNAITDNLNLLITNLIISIDSSILKDFENSVCDSRDDFKSNLFSNIKEKITNSKITIGSIPNYVDVYEFNIVVNLFMDQLKEKLIEQTIKLLVDELLPCKSCKPCADMTTALTISASNTIGKFKDTMKTQADIISSTIHDWEISDSQSIIYQKAYLAGLLNEFLIKPNGSLNLSTGMIHILQAEQKEILKNTKIIIEAI